MKSDFTGDDPYLQSFIDKPMTKIKWVDTGVAYPESDWVLMPVCEGCGVGPLLRGENGCEDCTFQDPRELREDDYHIKHYRYCGCLGDSAECCDPNHDCNDPAQRTVQPFTEPVPHCPVCGGIDSVEIACVWEDQRQWRCSCGNEHWHDIVSHYEEPTHRTFAYGQQNYDGDACRNCQWQGPPHSGKNHAPTETLAEAHARKRANDE